jgi:formamidopyrimidine-DNA glycosylase
VPELPEVEFAARTLRRLMLGRRVLRVETDARARRIFRPDAPGALGRALTGARLQRVDRRGKQLLLTFAPGARPGGAARRAGPAPAGAIGVASHLGMTGKWTGGPGAPATGWARASFWLDDGAVVHYDDPRMFGRLRLVPGADFAALPEVAALGPDPVADGLDARALGEGLAATRRPVKVALLDQSLLAGVGNIHAAEACWRARLDPRRRADRLSPPEVAALARGLRATFRFALAKLDGPEIEYIEEGGDNPFHVYGREGLRCRHLGCGGVVRRLVQAQRSTYLCPRCQR